MGTIKDRNSIDLIEAEDSKKKWQEYMEELYKKILSFISVYDKIHYNKKKENKRKQKLKLKKKSLWINAYSIWDTHCGDAELFNVFWLVDI